jgi:hypothetical protein
LLDRPPRQARLETLLEALTIMSQRGPTNLST